MAEAAVARLDSRELSKTHRDSDAKMPASPITTPSSPSKPDYRELQHLVTSLVKLARDSYSRKNKVVICANYMRLQPRINRFFKKTDGFDFLADGAYGYCIEMKCLAHIIEISVRSASWYQFEPIAWPSANLGEGEEQVLQKVVYQDVDQLIWGGVEVNFEPFWKSKGREEDDDVTSRPDSGYSSGSN